MPVQSQPELEQLWELWETLLIPGKELGIRSASRALIFAPIPSLAQIVALHSLSPETIPIIICLTDYIPTPTPKSINLKPFQAETIMDAYIAEYKEEEKKSRRFFFFFTNVTHKHTGTYHVKYCVSLTVDEAVCVCVF